MLEAIRFILERETLLLYFILIKTIFSLPYFLKKILNCSHVSLEENLMILIFNREQLSHSKICLYLRNA